MRILVFDIDGTLLLSGGAGARALDRAFLERMSAPEAMKGIHPDGLTDYDIIQRMGARTLGRALDDAELEAIRGRYAFFLKDELARPEGFRVLPGVRALLEHLAGEEDLLLGLVTGNFETTGRMKLAHGGLDRYFRFGGWGSDSIDRAALTRIGIERGRKLAGDAVPEGGVFLIGDTVHDIRCGREAGARIVAVATGSTPIETLREKDPDFLFDDLTDIERFLAAVRS
ncbi:MAG: HAD family hydrolase [Candidatus Eisenbacteria bacterium]